MALFHKSLDVSSGVSANPGTFNQYLKTHGGYVDNDLIIWNSTAALGSKKISSHSITTLICCFSGHAGVCTDF
jgi:hypothetical protein